MGQKHLILRGAFTLTAAGFLSRIMGFFYRIFLSRIIGAEGLGLYQMIFPLFGLALSVTSAGIQTAITHFVAGKEALKDAKGAWNIFLCGAALSLGLSLIVSFALYESADFLAVRFLGDTRCGELLSFLSFAIPFASFHSASIGYFMGQKKTGIPALSQLLEQSVRILSALLLHSIFLEKGIKITPLIAVGAMVLSEMAAVLFTLTLLLLEFSKKKLASLVPARREILAVGRMAAPLSANRLCVSLLQSVEAMLIPARLRAFGYSVSEALSHYGVLTGMALPLIMFPSAITGAISMLLIPTVSEAHTLNNRPKIARTVEVTVTGCLILGIFCTGVFLLFGRDLGTFLFGSLEAGDYILILGWICPFLYLSATLSSILNGLGKTMTTFFQNLIGISIRILFVWFFIPRLGITGYLLGMLVSQLTVAFLSLFSLHRAVPFSFQVKTGLLLPLLFLALAALLLHSADVFISALHFSAPSFWMLLGRGLLFTVSYIFFIFLLFRE